MEVSVYCVLEIHILLEQVVVHVILSVMAAQHQERTIVSLVQMDIMTTAVLAHNVTTLVSLAQAVLLTNAHLVTLPQVDIYQEVLVISALRIHILLVRVVQIV
jgi:hypothetical protein